MSAKRALVVDDSKSARAFLARILERHEIAVDAAESAEAAIEYLTRNKPDVIFMDHLMPGMDGFQAVQSIKNNPRTSAIPILMYTSQEGDLYAGQARALGAAGVLPKQIKQSDVTRMLFQLQLVSDRRGGEREPTTFMRMAHGMGNDTDLAPANESAIVASPPDAPAGGSAPSMITGGVEVAQLMPQLSLEIRAALDGSLQKELGELRSFIATQTERLQGDLAAALLPGAQVPEVGTATLLPERRAWPAVVGWSVALLAMAGAAFMSWMWWQQGAEVAALRGDLSAAYAELETLRARPEVVSPEPAAAADAAATRPDETGAAAAVEDPATAASAATDTAGATSATPTATATAPATPAETFVPLPSVQDASAPQAAPDAASLPSSQSSAAAPAARTQ
ncbi:MAG TPA: response regulator [Steroidobacteraceae bacterium]|jgi:CheY-like chemotaxis protein|nr:response regulator [Steroidobacteraceae bacterium]